MEISKNMFLGTIVLGFITLFVSVGILLFMMINTVTAHPHTFGQTEEQAQEIAYGSMRRMPRPNSNSGRHIDKKYWNMRAL